MDVVVVEFSGTIGDFPSLIQALDLRIADGDRRLVVDLATLPFINSAALGYLVRAQRTMEAHGGELVLARLQPALEHLMEVTHLDQVIPAFQTVEEAVAYLGGDPSSGEEAPRVRREPWQPGP